MSTSQNATPPGQQPDGGEQVDWIDESNRVLQVVSRAEMRQRNLLHRVTATFVFHPQGGLFVQRRTWGKDVYPGFFDLAVGGTVASGESFAANAAREVAEELGATGAPLYGVLQHRYQDSATNSLIQVFACRSAGPFVLQPEEVAEGSWADAARVDDLLRGPQTCPDSAQGWRLLQERYGCGVDFATRVAPGLDPVVWSGR